MDGNSKGKGRRTRRITKRQVDALKPGGIAWDADLPGFGIRCRNSGGKYYMLKYRASGRQRWFTIGRHGAPWTPEKARKEAKRLLGEVAASRDPADAKAEARAGITVSELCDLYLAEGVTTKKESTLVTDRGRIERHIKPLLGRRMARNVTRGDIENFMRDVAAGKTAADVRTGPRGRAIVRGGKGAAAKSTTLLGVILAFAMRRGIVAANPARGIKKFRDRKSERYLSAEELARLGDALTAAEREGEHPSAITALRLLTLSGCRKSEILTLRWDDVDFERSCLRMPDTKTGRKDVPLGAPALELLASLPRLEGNPFVCFGERTGGHFVGLQKVWERVRTRAGLEGLRIHDLRHTFASVGAAAGDSLLVIGALLGHRDQATTQRYAHLSNDPVRAAADRIAGHISAVMKGGAGGAEVVTLAKHRQQ